MLLSRCVLTAFFPIHIITSLKRLYIGIAVQYGPNSTLELGLVFHDGTYSADYEIELMQQMPTEDQLADTIIQKLDKHRRENLFKCVGAGVNKRAVQYSPHLLSRLWKELDIVPLQYDDKPHSETSSQHTSLKDYSVDEEADSLARKAVR
jgi:hypothetical protein